jgi:hypothetical protein
MTDARRLPLLAGLLLLVLPAMACRGGASAEAASLDLPGPAQLSPGLAVLASPPSSGVSEGAGLALAGEGPDPILSADRGMLVYVRFQEGAVAALEALRATGAQIVDVSRRYQTVTVAAKVAELRRVAAVPRVASVAPVRPPIVAGVDAETAGTAAATPPCFGAATSEGDLQLNAMAARDGFQVDGSGVEVGILSDSFNRDGAADTHANADIASGDLPGPANPCGYKTPVEVIDDGTASGEDEGRAMAQIVHDLAPGAGLAFASAFGGEPAFAENIGELAEEGAQVIVDDVFYLEEPFFQDGPVAVAVNKAVEGGATYLSAAGNDNLIDGSGNDIASWEAPAFRDAGSCPAAVVEFSEEVEEAAGPTAGLNPHHCMDFDPGPGTDRTFGIVVSKGQTLTLDLQWAEPRNGVTTDLDAFLLDGSGEVVELSASNNASPPKGTQQPVEALEWENDTGAAAVGRLVINRFSGSNSPRLKFALIQNGGGVTATEYPQSTGGDVVGPTIFGHSGSASAISVAAAPFFSDEEPEEYSSRGPVTHYFGPVEGPIPAVPLGSPEVIAKPDVTATDGGANTFFGSCVSHTWRFFGTSAAAPHAAAVAALELGVKSTATAAEVREALTETASPIGAFSPDAVGSGLVNAPEAIAAIAASPFPGGTQSAQPVPLNCGLPKTSGSVPQPVTPAPAPAPPATGVPKPSPRTFFRQRPLKVIRTRHRRARAVFRFGSNQTGVSFVCRVDGGPFRPCPERLVRRFTLGWHAVEVAARDASGGDDSPARYRFKVKRVR